MTGQLPTRMVTLMEAIRFGFKGSFRWNGRATRAEYWWWSLFTGIIYFVLQMVSYAFLFAVGDFGSQSSSGTVTAGVSVLLVLYGLFTMAVGLVLFFPTLAVTVRRLHDTGRPAWWILSLYILTAAYMASYVLLIVFAFASSSTHDSMDTAGGLAAMFGIAALIFVIATIGLGITIFVFTVLPTRPELNKWDNGYRPVRDLGLLAPVTPYMPAVFPAPPVPAPLPVKPYRLPDGGLMVFADPTATRLVRIDPGHPQYDAWAAHIDQGL